MKMHANKYDTLEVWCGFDGDLDNKEHAVDCGSGPCEDLDSVDCLECLDAIMAYGARAMNRKFDLVEQYIVGCKSKRGVP